MLASVIRAVQCWLASRCGCYRYEGLESFAARRGYPLGRVLYADGNRSMWMALGNAYDYAELFGGVVEYKTKEKHSGSTLSHARHRQGSCHEAPGPDGQ